MPSNKVPGQDGFPMEFYKAAWSVIGGILLLQYNPSSYFGFSPKSINATLLYLVPKTTTADRMTDFRPTACSNVI